MKTSSCSRHHWRRNQPRISAALRPALQGPASVRWIPLLELRHAGRRWRRPVRRTGGAQRGTPRGRELQWGVEETQVGKVAEEQARRSCRVARSIRQGRHGGPHRGGRCVLAGRVDRHRDRAGRYGPCEVRAVRLTGSRPSAAADIARAAIDHQVAPLAASNMSQSGTCASHVPLPAGATADASATVIRASARRRTRSSRDHLVRR